MNTNSEIWKKALKADPTGWLLEEDNPSVCYFTLKDILGKPENDPAVINARKAIMTAGIVPRILEKQNPDGSWGVPEDFYLRCKYHGTVWTTIVLAELGADGNDKRIKKTADFILSRSQDKQSGGFACQSGPEGDGGDHEKVVPCLTGNMVFSLIRFGFIDDPAVKRAIEFITKYQRFDDGIAIPPKGWMYTRFPNCWGKHTCLMGVVKSLKALAEIPVGERTRAVDQTIA
jgi:prenyltransferase beta subunit